MPLALGLAAAIAAVALASPAAAQPAGQPSCFDAAVSQADLTACAGAAARAADRRLNAVYLDLLRYLDAEERRKLVVAQRAWLAFRNADCGFWGSGDGSIAPMNRLNCLAERAQQRAEDLESWPPNSDRSAIVPKR